MEPKPEVEVPRKWRPATDVYASHCQVPVNLDYTAQPGNAKLAHKTDSSLTDRN